MRNCSKRSTDVCIETSLGCNQNIATRFFTGLTNPTSEPDAIGSTTEASNMTSVESEPLWYPRIREVRNTHWWPREGEMSGFWVPDLWILSFPMLWTPRKPNHTQAELAELEKGHQWILVWVSWSESCSRKWKPFQRMIPLSVRTNWEKRQQVQIHKRSCAQGRHS